MNPPSWLDITKDFAIILAGFIALITFLHGVVEYSRQGAQLRTQQFVNMRRRFMEEASFREMCTLLITDDPKLRDLPLQEKRNFGGFMEEMALLVNSGVLKKEVVHYMFGYYALLCWNSENFWHGIDRNSIYWSLFRDFAEQMKGCEANYKFDRKSLRF
ncbi:MAG: hypothetical protein ABJA67_14345 [Chthonomonadales bacterium]